MAVPYRPKVYHIVHVDRLQSIVECNALYCDATMIQYQNIGSSIGMNKIKSRRLERSMLASHPGLYVGECVPFYFCPRSIMLYLIYQANHKELEYRGGQGPIVHLVFDLHAAVDWANNNNKRWAFTLSNAGSTFFEDRCDLAQLNEVNWSAVGSNKWSGAGVSPSIKEGKQAEFLVETYLPWSLVEKIGVYNRTTFLPVSQVLKNSSHKPNVEIKTEWYYP